MLFSLVLGTVGRTAELTGRWQDLFGVPFDI